MGDEFNLLRGWDISEKRGEDTALIQYIKTKERESFSPADYDAEYTRWLTALLRHTTL